MHIVVFGDSIAQGFHDLERGGWVSLLSMYLQQKTIAGNYEMYYSVFNQSISGQHSRQIVDRIESELPSRVRGNKRNIFVLATGINNARRAAPELPCDRSLEETKADTEEAIEIAKKYCDAIVLVGPTAVDESRTSPYRSVYIANEDIRLIDETMKAVADMRGVQHISLFNTLTADHLYDGVHPTAAGHALLFEVIKGALETAHILK